MSDALRAEYDELVEYIDDGWEQYGELLAEYRGECARYGDAWPGAALEVAGFRQGLEESERRITFLADALGGLGPVHGPAVPALPTDDEPF